MQEVVGSNPTKGTKMFFTFYSIRVKCEELFWKTNIKLLKLIKQIKCIKNDDEIQFKLISYDALNAPRPCIKFMMRINSL